MRKPLYYLTLLLFIAACNSGPVNKPVWLNQSANVMLPADSFFFQSGVKQWEASVVSFTQPIPMELVETQAGFLLTSKNQAGITEGPAQLILRHGRQTFYYEFNLHNKSFGSISERDYRSPKTVNPDSSLQQQRMVHRIDEWRNVMSYQNSPGYFKEELLTLQPVAGTFRAQAEKPVSAFYVQPGSAISITVNSVFMKEENHFMVTAGPLKDKYNNTVANGTEVAFLYNDGETTYRTAASTIDGFASVKIPARKKAYALKAKVNETISATIQLLAR